MKFIAAGLAAMGVLALMFMSYNAGALRYECVSPANLPMGDGSGRWFYLCAGPEPVASQKVAGLAAARARLSAPTQEFPTNGSGYYPPPTARVSPAQPVGR